MAASTTGPRSTTPSTGGRALVAAIEIERTAALERDFIAFADRANRGAPGTPAECAFEYLLAVATRAGG